MALKENDATLREMRQILHLAAEPHTPHDNVAAAIGRAARVLSLGYRRAYSLWYGAERTLVRAEEAARLRAEHDRLLRAKLARLEREIAELRAVVRLRDAQAQAAAGERGSVADGGGPADRPAAARIGCVR